MRRIEGILVALLVGACGSTIESPRIDAVDPGTVSSLVATRAVLRGARLYGASTVGLDDRTPATIDRTWRVRLDDVELAASSVIWTDPEAIELHLPAGLPLGVHDVIATSPAGGDIVLPRGLTVTDEPIGLALSIEDAPGGAGAPVAATIAAGGEIFAYAVARDSSGAFVADVTADWGTTAPRGTIAAGPGSRAIFTATMVGTTRLTATRTAAALTAESGDLVVVAGPPARLVIADAPGGAGAPIGDRTGLTTDSDGGLTAYAIAVDAFGNVLGDTAATWSLTGISGALPSAASTTVAIDFTTPGNGVLHANAGGLADGATGTLSVAPGRAAVLAIAPPSLTISADAAPRTFAATAVDADGNATTNLGALTWSIASGPIDVIDPATGGFDPHTAGTGSVEVVSSWGVSAMSGPVVVTPGHAAMLAVSPPSLTINADAAPVLFTVTAIDGDSNATTDLGAVTWSIATGPISAIAMATGVFDPGLAGNGSIAASSSWGATATAAVTVMPGHAATLAIAPDVLDVVQGGATVPFAASALDADGNATSDLGTITWSIASGGISALDVATGVLTPLGPGSGVIHATSSYGAADDTGAIHIRRAATLAVALVAPASASTGQSFTVTATVTNAGESGAGGVTPCPVVVTGGGAVALVSGPTPASSSIAAGGGATFTWTFTATTPGTVQLTACATGTDAATAKPVASPSTTSAITVQTSAALSATLTIPALIARDQAFTLTMVVTDGGQAPANAVAPSAPVASGTGAAVLASGPSPAGASIAGGGSATFTWTYAATADGTITFNAAASGTDGNSGVALGASAQSGPATISDDAFLVASDPFGDGTHFAYVTGYDGEVYLGPSGDGRTAVRFAPDGTGLATVAFTFPRDVTGSGRSINAAPPPYSSLGATGCALNTLACGPDNENGRGIFASGTIAGVEWLVAAGARSAGRLSYLYMTTDTGTTLGFRYVDLSVFLDGQTNGTSAMNVLGNVLYVGLPDSGGNQPELIALGATPPSPGLDVAGNGAVDLSVKNIPGISPGAISMIDVLSDFGGRLYFANAGVWVRANVAVPRDYEHFPFDWRIITPTATAYTTRASRTTNKTADLEPSDRAVPQMAAFGGHMFAARNTTSGPQLWSCDPKLSGDPTQCDAGDWSLVAANNVGDTKLTQFDDPNLTSITMTVATPSYLYVGFDGASGVQIFRTSNPFAASRADFEGRLGCSAALHPTSCQGIGGPGLGDPINTRIFDAKALTFAASSRVYATVGDGVSPLDVYAIP